MWVAMSNKRLVSLAYLAKK